MGWLPAVPRAGELRPALGNCFPEHGLGRRAPGQALHLGRQTQPCSGGQVPAFWQPEDLSPSSLSHHWLSALRGPCESQLPGWSSVTSSLGAPGSRSLHSGLSWEAPPAARMSGLSASSVLPQHGLGTADRGRVWIDLSMESLPGLGCTHKWHYFPASTISQGQWCTETPSLTLLGR